MGDRSTARTALRSARIAWDDLDGSLSESVFSLSAGYMPYCELTMLAWLGEVGPARRLLDTHDVDSDAAPTVGRVIGQIDIALVRSRGGEIDEAVRVGRGAVVIGRTRVTPPLRDRVAELVGALTPYDRPDLRALRREATWTSV